MLPHTRFQTTPLVQGVARAMQDSQCCTLGRPKTYLVWRWCAIPDVCLNNFGFFWVYQVNNWNHFGNNGPLNTNIAGARHSKLNHSFGHPHPALHVFLSWFRITGDGEFRNAGIEKGYMVFFQVEGFPVGTVCQFECYNQTKAIKPVICGPGGVWSQNVSELNKQYLRCVQSVVSPGCSGEQMNVMVTQPLLKEIHELRAHLGTVFKTRHVHCLLCCQFARPGSIYTQQQ